MSKHLTLLANHSFIDPSKYRGLDNEIHLLKTAKNKAQINTILRRIETAFEVLHFSVVATYDED